MNVPLAALVIPSPLPFNVIADPNEPVSSTATPTVTPALDLLAASSSMQIAFFVAL